MSNPIYFTFDSVWAAPTKKSELPLKLSVLCILSYFFCIYPIVSTNIIRIMGYRQHDVGMWVEGKQGSKEGTFLAHESEGIMKDIWQHNRKDTNEVNHFLVLQRYLSLYTYT
jgi:hypothetical protein